MRSILCDICDWVPDRIQKLTFGYLLDNLKYAKDVINTRFFSDSKIKVLQVCYKCYFEHSVTKSISYTRIICGYTNKTCLC